MPQRYDIVIIGNSAAGLQAIRTIRRHSRRVSVALIDREAHPAYSRVLTPYYVGGKTDRANLFIVDQGFYATMGIVPFFGREAVHLDPDRHEIVLDNAEKLGFSSLLIAMGAEARQLSTPSARVCTLRHLADAEKLRGLIEDAASITAIGAGLVSVPCLSHAGPSVEKNLIVGSARVFSRVVDSETSEVLAERFLASGVSLHVRNEIEDVRDGDRLSLMLSNGKKIETDLLVVGKGVIPNTSLARKGGLAVGEGIAIDDYCRTSHPDVYAAGDVAEGRDFVTGEMTVQGNWGTAVEQGEVAALNMLGLSRAYEGSLKNNITEVFGTDVAAIGFCRDDAPRSAIFHDRLGGRYRKVFLDSADRIIGAALVGDTNDAGVWYQMVRTRSVYRGLSLQGSANHAAILCWH